MIAGSGASAVVTTPEFLAKVTEAVRGLPSVRFLCTEVPGADVLPLDSLLHGEAAPIAPRGNDDLAALLYTGGTTGQA